jgi:hypothetical protein
MLKKHIVSLLIIQIIVAGCANSSHQVVTIVRPSKSESSVTTKPQEDVPAGIIESPIDISQTLDIYAKLTGASMDVEESVRETQRIVFGNQTYPAMTKAQARDFLEKGLRAAGVVVIHQRTNHVVFRLQH